MADLSGRDTGSSLTWRTKRLHDADCLRLERPALWRIGSFIHHCNGIGDTLASTISRHQQVPGYERRSATGQPDGSAAGVRGSASTALRDSLGTIRRDAAS